MPAGGIPSRILGVSDGTRTRDVLDHNQVLYQLSYTHRVPLAEAPPESRRWVSNPCECTGLV